MVDYSSFEAAPSAKQWQRLGLSKRSGVATPLFSVYSKNSVGIGEFPDLKLLCDWAKKCAMSIIQLLPLNDVGFNFTPYDGQSMFALDPMFLSLSEVSENNAEFKDDIEDLRIKYPLNKERVDYGIKREKLALLKKIFEKENLEEPDFLKFQKEQAFWLRDFALYKVIKEDYVEGSWQSWPEPLRDRHPEALAEVYDKNRRRIMFYEWLQWCCFLQMSSVNSYARERGIFILGDLPFLVSRDSADVWTYQEYFKLHLGAGAPPDPFFAQGQNWGMPPYNWQAIRENNFDYLKAKLKYAECFYDLFRIDHAVGLFRVWTIPTDEPPENGGLNGEFDPPNEEVWEAHGKEILDVMLSSTGMLPCAEDLGTVPECSYKILSEYAIPGMDIQRWMRDWGETFDFKKGEKYRKNSVAVISTHDMSSFRAWWNFEAGTVDEHFFKKKCDEMKIDFNQIKPLLFNLKESCNGRLKWDETIKSQEDILQKIQIEEEHAYFFADAFLGTFDEKEKFMSFLEISQNSHTSVHKVASLALKKTGETDSIFSIQLLQDWMSADETFECDDLNFRINLPGTIGPKNWTLLMPWSLETLLDHPLCDRLRKLNQSCGRI